MTIAANISQGMTLLQQTTASGQQMTKSHGSDWTKWPVDSNWFKGLKLLDDARREAQQLPVLTAGFTESQK